MISLDEYDERQTVLYKKMANEDGVIMHTVETKN